MREQFPTNGIRLDAARTGRLSAPQYREGTVPGLKTLARHIYQMGGRTQQERMIRDKRRSLDKAVLYSYQGAFVKKFFPLEEEVTEQLRNQPPVRALINPDKVKQDYDDKIISIGYEHGFQPGDVFEWVNTDTHWLIYLQDKTELAYFRGEIRRCRYTIQFKDEDGNVHFTYAAIRGPVETKINYIQKNNISVDEPNHSLSILLPANEFNLQYFQRYKRFYLVEDFQKICWRVEAIDWISTPGILQVIGVEYYQQEHNDDIENGIADGFIVKPDNPNSATTERKIDGETFIKPKIKYTYIYTGSVNADWVIDTKKYPIQYKLSSDNAIELMWTGAYSGQFEIKYGDLTKTIVVESLF